MRERKKRLPSGTVSLLIELQALLSLMSRTRLRKLELNSYKSFKTFKPQVLKQQEYSVDYINLMYF